MTFRNRVFALMLAASAIPAHAAGFADLTAIDREVARFIAQESGRLDAIMPVDRRLRLSPCGAQLALSWFGKARNSVLVQCPVPGGWRLFVPVPDGDGAPGLERAVARGDQVTIVVRGDSYRLTDRGTALGAGAAGDWIAVRPLRKDAKPLQARVISPGVVDIQLP